MEATYMKKKTNKEWLIALRNNHNFGTQLQQYLIYKHATKNNLDSVHSTVTLISLHSL